jgi:hypothetical protein
MNPLVRQAVDLIAHHKFRIGRLLKRAGLNDTALCHWRHGGNPSVHNFEAFLNAMGYHLEIVENVDIEEHQQRDLEGGEAVRLADALLHSGGQTQPAHDETDQQDRRNQKSHDGFVGCNYVAAAA